MDRTSRPWRDWDAAQDSGHLVELVEVALLSLVGFCFPWGLFILFFPPTGGNGSCPCVCKTEPSGFGLFLQGSTFMSKRRSSFGCVLAFVL